MLLPYNPSAALMAKWNAVRAAWNDIKAEEFEGDYLQPTLREFEKVSLVLDSLRSELQALETSVPTLPPM